MNSWLNEHGVKGVMELLVERVLVEVESENRGGGKTKGVYGTPGNHMAMWMDVIMDKFRPRSSVD